MCVVPADEIDGGDTARQVLTGDVQHAIGLRADGVDHGVVALGELAGLDVFADDHIAEEAEAGVLGRLFELLADRLDLGVIRRDPGAHQPPGVGNISSMSTAMSRSSVVSAAFSKDAAAKNADGPEPTMAM